MRKRAKASAPEKRTAQSTRRIAREVYGNTDELVDTEVHVFETEPAYVRVNGGTTKNLGNYESLRVDVSITVPCYVEDIQPTFESIADEVAERLDEEVKNYLGESED